VRYRADLAHLVIPSPSAHPPGSGFAWADGEGTGRLQTSATGYIDYAAASIPETEVPARGIDFLVDLLVEQKPGPLVQPHTRDAAK